MMPRMMNHDIEIWRPVAVPEFGDFYEVSDQGRVRSLPRMGGYRPVAGRVLKPGKHGTGYLNIVMSIDGIRVYRLIHQLVLEAFVGPPEPGQEARHLNGDRGDNRLDNLAWGTSAENEADKLRHGTSNHGEGNGMAKLTLEQVLEIRRRYADGGESQYTLAAAYGVRQGAISRVVTGKRWGHLTGS